VGRAHITVPIAGGLATGTDTKLLQPPNVDEMRNVRQGRQGEVVPRFGTVLTGTGLMGTSDTLTPPWALGTLRGELVAFPGVGPHPANGWSPAAAQWSTDVTALGFGVFNKTGAITTGRRGPVASTPIRVAPSGGTPCIAYASGYYFVSYQSVPATGGSLVLHEMVIDAVAGTILYDRVFDDALGFVRAVVATVNGFAVFARATTANDIAFDTWTISNLDAGPSTTVLATTMPANPTAFDMIVKNATTLALLFDDGTNLAAADFVPSTLTITAWGPRTAAAGVIARGQAAAWMRDNAGAGTQSIIDTSGGTLNVQWALAAAGATRNATTSFLQDAAPPAPTGNVTGTTRSNSGAGDFMLLYDTAPTTTATSQVNMSSRGSILMVGAQVLAYGVCLRSTIFLQGADYYVWVERPSRISNARYLMRVDMTAFNVPPAPFIDGVVSKTQVGGVSIPPFPNTLSPVVTPGAGTWTMADAVQLRVLNQSVGYNPFNAGIEMVVTSFKSPGDTTLGAPYEAIDSLFVPGGSLGQFDGTTYADAGFAWNPEAAAIGTDVAGGAQTAGATYYYKVVYAYTDLFGRRWRSAPSLVASHLMVNTKVTITAETLRVSERFTIKDHASLRAMDIEFYRGGANDNVTFQLAGTVANDPSAQTVNFVDGQSDAVVATGEFLYTNGGGSLPNDCIPGFTAIGVAGNRMFGVSADDPQCIWPSSLFVPGQGLRFSEQTKLFIRDQHGPITGLAAQPNGTMLAFKRDAVYLISGTGPDQAGRGSFNVQIVAIGLGTVNPRSIVETSLGAEFLSTATRAGWWRINLGQAPEYIGSAVERYNTSTIVGAVMVPSESATRYYLASGGCLVHNVVTGLWSLDTGTPNTTGATAYLAGAAYGTTNPAVLVDDPIGTIGNDPITGAYTMLATTPWLKFAELRGYERVRRARGVGELNSPEGSTALTTVALQKDLIAVNVSPPQTIQALAMSATWDWEMRYSAKFEAARYVISTIPSLYDNPAGIKWTAIVVEYDVKQGLRPQASGKRTT
jgi:hypothetical protein